MGFKTKLDYSDNRQIRQTEKTSTTLSGATVFGIPFSGLTTGPDLSATGDTSEFSLVISTFSGNNTTTNFTWFDPSMDIVNPTVSAITPVTSGVTQEIVPVFGPSTTATTVDGYDVVLSYSGVGFDLTVTNIISGAGPTYIGTVVHNLVTFYSAATLDFLGRPIWVDNPEITRTNRLIVKNNPTIGYVLTCDTAEGEAVWGPVSGTSSSGVTFWEEGGTGNTAIKDNKGTHTINGTSNNSMITGGLNNMVKTSLGTGILSGRGNSIEDLANYSTIIGGLDNKIENSQRSSIIGGNQNILIGASNSTILGGEDITGTSNNTVYVDNLDIKNDLVINNLGSGPGTTDLGVDATGVVVDQASDINLKENINTIENALDKVLSLRGVTYNWKDRQRGGNDLRMGFIAQEVDDVEPNLSYMGTSGFMGVHYKDFPALIVEAIKELVNNKKITFNKEELIFETQTIASEDNNIELNYNGTHESSIDGGITVVKGIDEDNDSTFVVDSVGDWITNTHLKPSGLVIPEYTPTSTEDLNGKVGEIKWDDKYLYVKTNNGWKRSGLETF
tara:strand:+ start:4234 stop:5910 length:1677 start_codon:yes stop_codon:yes gene_type:complete